MPTGSGDPLVEGGAVLLRDDLRSDADGHYCEQSLTAGPSDERAEVRVMFPEAVDRVGMDGDSNGRQPAKRGVIAVGDTMHVHTIASDKRDFEDPLVLDGVPDPTDLRSIGTTVSEFCKVLGGHYRLTLCFDSLSDLLAHNDPQPVFQFTHVLLKRLEAVDAVAHFHVDPTAHDEQVLGTFEDLFEEEFVEFEADDEALDISTGRSRATDGDVAEQLDSGAQESRDRTEPVSEATDEDIADALRE